MQVHSKKVASRIAWISRCLDEEDVKDVRITEGQRIHHSKGHWVFWGVKEWILIFFKLICLGKIRTIV